MPSRTSSATAWLVPVCQVSIRRVLLASADPAEQPCRVYGTKNTGLMHHCVIRGAFCLQDLLPEIFDLYINTHKFPNPANSNPDERSRTITTSEYVQLLTQMNLLEDEKLSNSLPKKPANVPRRINKKEAMAAFSSVAGESRAVDKELFVASIRFIEKEYF